LQQSEAFYFLLAAIFTTMDAAISFAAPDDISQLRQLVNNAYRGEAAKKGWTHEADLMEGNLRTDETELLNLIQKPDSVVVKYSDNGRIIGCVHLKKQDTKLYLGMLSVDPEKQAKGIGKKLLHAAEEYARELSCTHIEMTVISVRHELIAWYERNGYYKTSQTKPFHTNERFGIPRQSIEFIVMEKKLT